MPRWLPKSKVGKMAVLMAGAVAGVLALLFLLNFRTPAETDLRKSALWNNPPPALQQPITVRVVTFNVFDLLPWDRHRKERMAAIGDALAALAPDLVGFQEAFHAPDRAILLERLAAAGLSHSTYFRSGLVGSGLLVASRWPIREAFFHRYTQGGKPYKIHHGDWWAGKGAGVIRVELPQGAGYLDFFDTHSHARYGGDTYEMVRQSNLEEMAEFVNEASLASVPAVVVGDFNAKPGTPQYETLVREADLVRLMRFETGIDHIFVVENLFYTFELVETLPIKGELIFDGQPTGLSDHTGYLSEIRIAPAANGGK